MGLDGSGVREGQGEIEGRDTVIRIYYVRKKTFSVKGKKMHEYYTEVPVTLE